MNTTVWKFYKGYYGGCGFRFILTIFLSMLQAVSVVPVALMVRLIFDEAIPGKDVPKLIVMCLIILLLYLLNGGLTLWTRFLSLDTTKKAIKRLRDDLIRKIYSLPRSCVSRIDGKIIHARMVQDSLRVDIMSNALLVLFLPSLFISIGLVAVLIYLNALLFSILVAIVPLIYIFNKLMGGQLKTRVNRYHRYFEVFSKKISWILETMDLTRIQSREKEEIAEQKRLHNRLRKHSTSQAWFNGAYQVIQKTTLVSMGALVLAVGGYLVIKGKISLGELFSFFAALGLLRNYLLTMGGAIPGIVEGRESLKALHDIMVIPETLPYQGRKKITFKGEISFHDVVFGYGPRKVLRQISFTLPPHQVLCLQGANGSGKTTIANLILGFYRPERGRILADGHPYDRLDLVHLRRFLGVVQQDPIIFSGTLLENITYGHSGIGDEKIREILRLTHCEEFIGRLPRGLATSITERGYPLSGGEIQRIVLARALMGEPALLILDEPSNHLDHQVMGEIISNIKKMKNRPSILLISRDQSVALRADLIVLLENGTVNRIKNTGKR